MIIYLFSLIKEMKGFLLAGRRVRVRDKLLFVGENSPI